MALRRIVEKYTKTTRFCLICNYISKIIPPLQSRCTRFRFGPLKSDSVYSKLVEISQKENLELDEAGARAIVKLSGGDMRKVLNILESCSLAHKSITEKEVFEVTGRPSPEDINLIYEALNMKKFNEALNEFMTLKLSKSLALEDVLIELHKGVMLTKYTEEMKIYLINRMAEIEYRIA
jgi:replication factor C subunit 3/5